MVYKTPRRDQLQQSADIRKAEVFVNACRFERSQDELWTAESVRQVNQAKQSGFTYDYEILQHFDEISKDAMHVQMRVAAFLVPQAPAYFESQGKAVAIYDYTLAYKQSALD